MSKSKQPLDFNCFDFPSTNIAVGKGRILVAEPLMQCKYFGRSIVLLSEQNDMGSMGFVLNNPLSFNVNEMVDALPNIRNPLFLGGPVHTNHLFYMHTLGKLVPHSVPIADGIYWGGKLEVLSHLVEEQVVTQQQVRFFSGYAGWSAGQLEAELKEKSWLVAEVNISELLSLAPDKMWEKVVANLGSNYAHWLNFPKNPQDN